jgi:hypothetical protein
VLEHVGSRRGSGARTLSPSLLTLRQSDKNG